MSTAAQPKTTATSGSGYEVARPQGKCAVCGEGIEPDQKLMAALRETPMGYERIDCHTACWDRQDRGGMVAFWQTVMPRPEAKKKLFVDDAVLCEIFERLGSATEQPKLAFRFVLGLILMRKRLVIYDNTRKEGAGEVWKVRLKGRQDSLELVNPHLGEEQIREVSQQLGEILQQEL